MKNTSLNPEKKVIEPPRNYSLRVPLVLGTLLVATALTSRRGFGITDAIYESGIKLINKYPKIKGSKLGTKIRDGLVSKLINNALLEGIENAPTPKFRADPYEAKMIQMHEPDKVYNPLEPYNYAHFNKESISSDDPNHPNGDIFNPKNLNLYLK